MNIPVPPFEIPDGVTVIIVRDGARRAEVYTRSARTIERVERLPETAEWPCQGASLYRVAADRVNFYRPSPSNRRRQARRAAEHAGGAQSGVDESWRVR